MHMYLHWCTNSSAYRNTDRRDAGEVVSAGGVPLQVQHDLPAKYHPGLSCSIMARSRGELARSGKSGKDDSRWRGWPRLFAQSYHGPLGMIDEEVLFFRPG